MKFTTSICLFALLLLLGCKKEEPVPADPDPVDMLESIGLLGEWEIEGREVAGISGGAALCCEFLDFLADTNPEDHSGTFSYAGNGHQYAGTFQLTPADSSLIFAYDNQQRNFIYTLQGDRISFQYEENGSTLTETYRKK